MHAPTRRADLAAQRAGDLVALPVREGAPPAALPRLEGDDGRDAGIISAQWLLRLRLLMLLMLLLMLMLLMLLRVPPLGPVVSLGVSTDFALDLADDSRRRRA